MENSPLIRLPAELRNDIFSMVLTQPRGLELLYHPGSVPFARNRKFCATQPDGSTQFLNKVLAITAVCKQIRQETKGVFFHENEIVSDFSHHACSPESWSDACVAELRSMPAFLRPQSINVSLGICQVQQHTDMTGVFMSWCHKIIEALARHVELKVTIVVSRIYHKWANSTCIDQDPVICDRDTPLTLNGCGRFDVSFSAGGMTESYRNALNTAYEAKKTSLEAHFKHRFCPISVEKDRLLPGLEEARNTIRAVLSNIP